MRILFTRFPLESSFGGAEVQTLSLMQGLNNRGHAVAFMGSCPELLQKCREEAIPTVELLIGPPPVTKRHVLSFFWRRKRMKRRLIDTLLAQRPTPDALFMLSLSEKLLLTEAALERGISVFWIEHDRVGCWLSKNPWLPRLRELSKKVTTIVVSELSRKIYIDLGWDPEKIVAIPNGVDVSQVVSEELRVESEISRLTTHDSRLRIGCIARLTPDKGIDLLIEAVADLPEVSLTIVGQGREEKNLKQLIKRANGPTGQRIKLLRAILDLAAFYRSLDILVLPSREHDPFGMVAAEAMFLEIPVIVTNQCGIAGYLRDGVDAVIVKANSAAALKEGFARLSEMDIRKSIGGAGKEMAKKKFALSTMIDHYEKLLKEKNGRRE